MEDREIHVGRVKHEERSKPTVQERIYASSLADNSVMKIIMTSHTGRPT